MIRRLHEIEPPKLALPSEQSNKSEDPTAKESLASEFKKLLERARGGLSGARDEVSALGFALSQAVSSVQQQHVQVQGPEQGRETDSNEDAGEGFEDEAVDCSGQRGGVVMTETSRRRENGPVDDGSGDDESGLGTDLEDLEDGAIDLDQGGEEITLDDEIVYAALEDLDLDSDLTTDDLNLGAQLTSQHLAVSQNHTEVAQNIESDLEIEVESGLKRVALSGDEEVEEETWSEDFVSDEMMSRVGASELARPQLSSKHGVSKGGEQRSTGNEEIDRLLARFQTEESPSNAPFDGEFQPRTLGGEGRLGQDLDRAGVALRREISEWSDTNPLMTTSPTRERNSELSMQLSLLRQAYDSLKTQTSSSIDSKSKSQSAGISGVGATAEPRAAQNDGAPRVAKYLNRATSQKMMERIETALKEAARSRDGKTITLRLDPMQLGQVKCDVSMRDGLLHARITPQNQDVVNAVREHAHELQTALRRLGLNVDRVTVQVLSEKDTGGFAQNQGFLDGKSFQDDGNNMPGKERQAPENTFGNEFADVPRSGVPDAGITPADHLIA
jgi:flagellar hook-length control protein FliK